MSVTIQKERRKSRHRKYKIRVRYNHRVYKTIETEDYGTFKEMYGKYKGKYQFWCGDYPPEKLSEHGNYAGFRLDSDMDPAHERYTLRRFGRHKAWLDSTYRVDGKPVILVFNAGFGGNNQKTTEWNRKEILRLREVHGIRGNCICCGSDDHIEPDHIVSLFHKRDKTNTITRLKRAIVGNLQTLCSRCNKSKDEVTSICKLHGIYLGIWNYLSKLEEME